MKRLYTAQRRPDGQQVPGGRELQPLAVKNHQRHARKGQDSAANERPAQVDVFQAIGKSTLP